MPKKFVLHQNYPNPFNPGTTIRFSIAEPSNVSMTIYNIQGHKVKTLLSNYMDAAEYETEWGGKDDKGQSVASGLYFYRIQAGMFSMTRKMILLK